MSHEIFIVDPGYADVNRFEDTCEAVWEEVEDLRNQFEVAEELLKLVGREHDAQVVDELTTLAYERNRKRPALTTVELVQVVAAIHGLTADYLAQGYFSSPYVQAPEQIERLRGKTAVLPYDKTDHANQRHLLIQTLAGVATLEDVLQRAIDMNAHVALSY